MMPRSWKYQQYEDLHYRYIGRPTVCWMTHSRVPELDESTWRQVHRQLVTHQDGWLQTTESRIGLCHILPVHLIVSKHTLASDFKSYSHMLTS